jgi:putative phage-type endonuclease
MTSTKSTSVFDVGVSSADRAAWLEARRSGLGSSDAPVALGLSPWRSRLQLYAEKIGVEPEAEAGEPAYWGSILEPHVLERFAKETGRTVTRAGVLLRSRPRPWQLATLDGQQFDAARGVGPGFVEVKCTSLGGRWDEGVPPYVTAQVQHQLAVTGYTWGSVAVLFNGRDFHWVDVERDDGMIAWLNEAELAFWRAVEKLEPPDPLGTDDDRKTIARLFPEATNPDPLVLDGSWLDLDERRDEIQTEAKRLGAEELEIENRIKLAIGEHAAAILPNGVTYTYKKQTRKGYTVEPAEFRVLRRFEPKSRR